MRPKPGSKPKEQISPMNNLAEQIERCSQVWLETLKFFKQERKILAIEKLRLGQALQRYDLESVELALIGLRYEKGNKDYDPAQHVYLDRVFRPDRFARFVGLGATEMNRRVKEAVEKTSKALPEAPQTLAEKEVALMLGRWAKRL